MTESTFNRPTVPPEVRAGEFTHPVNPNKPVPLKKIDHEEKERPPTLVYQP